MRFLQSYLTLCRPGISSLAACSTATGYVLSSRHPSVEVLVPAAGVFLLACGSSALNQIQERKTDALMERTMHRPVPSGSLPPLHALAVSVILIITGLFLLGTSGAGPLALGLAAVLWYNGLYTRLKKRTAFASVPGALIGAIPPAIGWISAGGALLDARLSALCILFFLWQVPHFWLLVLKHGEEYARAGLPSLARIFSQAQLERLTYVWTVATAAATLALPLYGITKSPAVYLLLLPASLWLAGKSAPLFRKDILPATHGRAFRRINIYLLLIMLTLSLDALFA
jgi:protoheme IX farnesyltransferase